MKRRTITILLSLALVATGLWWQFDDLSRFATARVPALAAYLPADAKAGTAVATTQPTLARAAVPVVVATVERRTLPVTVEAVGTVQPLSSIGIKARIDSQIARIAVEEGALVKQGDLLVTLDDRALRAQLAQADALVAKDKAQLAQTRRDLARVEDLLAKRIASEVQRDTVATNVKIGEAQLAADEAQKANLAAALSYTEIRAPVSGRIGSVALKAGATVKAADTIAIMTVNQLDPIYVSFSVPQTLFGDLRRALAAGTVSVEARFGRETAMGTIAFTENAVDPGTGTILAKAIMPNAAEKLWPGAFVAVKATLGVQAEAVAVPTAAVGIGQQGPFVFVVRDNRRAELVPVTVERAGGGWTVVTAGVTGGEKVAVEGQLRLVHGATVQIQAAPAAADGVATGGSAPDAGNRRS